VSSQKSIAPETQGDPEGGFFVSIHSQLFGIVASEPLGFKTRATFRDLSTEIIRTFTRVPKGSVAKISGPVYFTILHVSTIRISGP
jgi:hypothetical protein